MPEGKRLYFSQLLLLFLLLPVLIDVPPVGEARAVGIAHASNIISEQWMELRMHGSKIGFTYRKMEKTSSGYRLTAKTVMKVKADGKEREISSSHTYLLDEKQKPSGFTFIQKMDNHQQYFEGKIDKGMAEITVRSGGNTSKRKVPFPETVEFAETASYKLGKQKLEPGMEFEIDIFMEPLLVTEKMKIKIGKKTSIKHRGKSIEVFKVTAAFPSYETVSYITPEGKTLREESPIGFTAVDTDKADAVSFSEGVMPFTQLLTFSLIPVTTSLEDAGGISKLILEMDGLPRKDLIPSDSRQKQKTVSEKTGFHARIEVVREEAEIFINASAGLPVEGMEKFLEPTIEAQSDDQAIASRAEIIIGDEKNIYKAAQLINGWVYKNIRKSFIDTFSAVETLRSMEGECQSHTNLFAALAKSVGIPVKTVSGIVYSGGYNGFLYHAWPEIYVGDGVWVAMDPTLGQVTVDATHIKLVEGDLSKQMQIFEFIGKVGIEIISVERNG
jgi:hypothetical protein